MRWHKNRYPSLGEIREKSWFAILPVTIRGETRWLERVTVKQQREMRLQHHGDIGYTEEIFIWSNLEFVDGAKEGSLLSLFTTAISMLTFAAGFMLGFLGGMLQ